MEENSIACYKSYTVQIKQPDQQFEVFDPNMIAINVYFWRDSNEGKPENDLPCDVITISRKEKLSELKKRIFELYNIPEAAKVYAFKKMDLSNGAYNLIEIMKNKEDFERELLSNAIFDNSKIYVEIVENETEEEPESKFIKLFGDKLSQTTIRFNFPVDPLTVVSISPAHYKWENEIKADKNATLRSVKQKIAEFLNLEENKFIIKLHSHITHQVRNLDVKVDTITKTSLNVYTEFGTPIGPGNKIK